MATTEQRLRTLIAEQLFLDEDEVKLESNFIEDLGADSLDLVEIAMAVEEDFELVLPDESTFKTVKDIFDYIETHKKT
jgi:acyl carrier protein